MALALGPSCKATTAMIQIGGSSELMVPNVSTNIGGWNK